MASEQLTNIVQVLRATRARAESAKGDVDIVAARDQMELAGEFFPPPDGTSETPVDAGGVPSVWVRAPGVTDDRTLLYLHGGGYHAGSPTSHRGLTGRLSAATGWRVLAADYRLAPEHPFPAAVDDARAVYQWLLDQGVSAEHVTIAGDSAGGGLTAALLLALKDAGTPLPAAAALLSPWLDMECSGASMVTRAEVDPMIDPRNSKLTADAYLGGADARTPYASPLFGDLAGLPPLLIQVGDYEVLLDDSVRFAERAKAAGVDLTLEVAPEMIHVWQFFAGTVPESDAAVDRIAEFLRKYAD